MAGDLFDATRNASSADGRGADDASAAEHSVRGEVLRVVFASDDGQYVVLRLKDSNGREQTLVGPMTGLLEGQEIEATGKWETHREHGRQFRVEEFKAVLPSSEEGIRRYLASGLIHGIGPKYAERIVEHFGTDTLDVLGNYSARLKEVPGIGRKRIAEIRKAWQEHAQQRDILIFLQGLGLSTSFCARIINRYGVAAPEVVRRNPYRLAGEIHGIGFLTADRIAHRLGVSKDNPLRLTAGIVHVLDQLSLQGHVCFESKALVEKTAEILDVETVQAEAGLKRALAEGNVVAQTVGQTQDLRLIYPRWLYVAETELAEAINTLLANRSRPYRLPLRALGLPFERLNTLQKQCVERAFTCGCSIVTGGPGVGKTTAVGQIVEAARHLQLNVLLAAPTGRAAKRMTEATGLEARTIHRLLRWDPNTRAFVHGVDRPLRCDMLIVDEVSMLDVMLANSLFRAVSPGTHVVLVGDRDQLPSVGPGAVLHDFIKSGRVPVTELTEIYRQAADSRIVTNAHRVNRGLIPDLTPVPQNVRADFYWIENDDPERVADMIARMVAERIPSTFRLDPMSDIQVLTPMHRGTCGAISLNERLQDVLNPEDNRPRFRYGERTFRVGDRVMQTLNNYDKGVFNGELGRITYIDPKKKTFSVIYDIGEVEYDWSDGDQILHAYAVTVHKSQGSEFPAVIMPVLTQHYIMLQRNLVYTGMTRARQLLVMVGTRKALEIAIGNNRPMQRNTLLNLRISGAPLSAPETDADSPAPDDPW